MELAENVVIAQRFRLNRLIGRGGMGSVWQATHLGLDVPCAVKFIEGAHASLGDANARFEREAKAAAQLRSPNVVQILDHGVFEGRPYIAMELLEGEELGSRLRRLQRLAPRDILWIVRDVARALAKAHALGIVHRDLKPDNIFLVRDGDREIAKVLDFGIAKMQSIDLTAAKTQTGAMLGTPYYMSPEQAQGTRSVDTRADLWSLGVIVYECLTGLRPFESDALGDLLMKILVLPIPVPSAFAPVPPGFDAWWMRAVARDPAARFQTSKDFVDALAVVLGGAVDTVPLGAPMGAGSGPLPNAPPPGALPAQAVPWTPNPAGGPVWTPMPAGAPGISQNTGGAISRTLGGSPIAKKKSAAAVAVAVSVFAIVAVAGIAGAVLMASRGRSSAPTVASAPPVTSAVDVRAITAPAAVPPAPATDPLAGASANAPAESASAASATAPATAASTANAGAARSAGSAPESRSSGATAATGAKPRATKPPAGAPAQPTDRSGF